MKAIIKKILIAITILPTIVWIVIKSIAIKSYAIAIAPAVLGGFYAILAGLLVAGGVSVNTDSGSVSGQAIYDLPAPTIEAAFTEYFTSEEGQNAIKNGLLDTTSAASDLSDWIMQNITDGSDDNSNKYPAVSGGTVLIAQTILDWFEANKENVSADIDGIAGCVASLVVPDDTITTRYYGVEAGQFYNPSYDENGILISFFARLKYNRRIATKNSNGNVIVDDDSKTTNITFQVNPSTNTKQFIGTWEWVDTENPPIVDVIPAPAVEDPTIDDVISNADGESIIDLLQQIISTVDGLSVPSDDTSVDDLINSATISLPDELSELQLKPSIASVFPFCIPFDFVRGIKLLAVKPQAPRFEVPFILPEFGSFPGVDEKIVIDFADYSKYFDVVRWGNYVIFLFGLCFVTFKLVKGA